MHALHAPFSLTFHGLASAGQWQAVLPQPGYNLHAQHHPPRPKLKATFNAEASLGWVQLFHQYLGIPALELGRLGHNGGVFQYEDYVVKVRLLFTCSSTGIL